MKDYKIIFADIDGTLVNSDEVMTEKTADVLNRLHAHGVKFAIASGRRISQLMDTAKSYPLDFDIDGCVGLNGGGLWLRETGEEYSLYPLQPETIKEIVLMLEGYPHIDRLNYYVYYKDGSLYRHPVEFKVSSSTKEYLVNDISEFWQAPAPKMLIIVPEELMSDLIAYCDAHSSDKFKGVQTRTFCYEFVDARLSKGAAIQQYCQITNTDISEVLAFGDMSNDKEMLKVAGTGVCLINGSDDSKANADYITEKTNDEDGMADWLEKYVLIPNKW